jgi:zinc finger HIT domain-containing protein 1
MSASVTLRKRRSVASRPITNRPQTITGQQNKALDAEQERERQAKQLDARRRRARRRLDELERINYRDAPTASSSASGVSTPLESNEASGVDTESAGSASAGVSVAQRRRNQAEIKRILVGGRRNLHALVEELVDQGRLPLVPGKDAANWRSVRSAPPTRPARRYCSICGFHGDIACTRCAQRVCSRKCRDT